MVELLLRGGTELRLPDRHGDTPVHIAARLGHVQCLEKMFPMVDRPMCELRHSQLFSYVECRKPSPITSLLNFDGESRINEWSICSFSFFFVFELFCEKSIHVVSTIMCQVYMCVNKHTSLCVISYFVLTDLLTCAGYSPMHLAVQSGHLAVVKLLVAAKADVNQPDGRSGRVALHHAVEAANVAITGFLVLEVSWCHH